MTDPTAPNESAAIGRDALGRFAPGNRGGPGRRPRPDFATIVDAHLSRAGGSVEKAIAEIFDSMRAAAAGGDVAAARLLLDRLAPVEKDGAGGRDLEALLAETAFGHLPNDQREEAIASVLATSGRRGRLPIGVQLSVVTSVPEQNSGTTTNASAAGSSGAFASPPAAPGCFARDGAAIGRDGGALHNGDENE